MTVSGTVLLIVVWIVTYIIADITSEWTCRRHYRSLTSDTMKVSTPRWQPLDLTSVSFADLNLIECGYVPFYYEAAWQKLKRLSGRSQASQLKGGQGLVPPDGEKRPEAPPSPPQKRDRWEHTRRLVSESIHNVGMELQPMLRSADPALRLEIMKLAVQHAGGSQHSPIAAMVSTKFGEPHRPLVDRLFAHFMQMVTMECPPEMLLKPGAAATNEACPVDEAESQAAEVAHAFSGDDPLRGSGRTYGGILRAIGHAMEAPGEWVPFVDHSNLTLPAARQLASVVTGIIERLHLKMTVETHGDHVVWIRSQFDVKAKGFTKP